MLKKFWTGKPFGLIAALSSLIGVLVDRTHDKYSTWVWKNNLKEFGNKSVIQFGVTIRYPDSIYIKEGVNIGRNVKLISEVSDSKLIIDDYSQVNMNVNLDFTGGLSISKNVVISEGVKIYTHSHGYDPKSKPSMKPLRIEDNVWIGANCLILENVEIIEEGALIAAGSVVTKNVKRNSIVGGNPAKLISDKIRNYEANN